MFLKLFRSQYIFQIIIFLLISLFLWTDAFIFAKPMAPASTTAPLYQLLYNELSGFKLFSVFLAFLFLIYESLYVNKILSDNKLIPRNTFLPAFTCSVISGDLSSSFPTVSIVRKTRMAKQKNYP